MAAFHDAAPHPMTSKKLAGIAAGVALALAAAVALNPSAQRHRERIQAHIAERSPIAGALGLGVFTAWVSDYRSLGVCSYTLVNGKTASFGAFGAVYVFD
jgi:hypothetical protein